MTTAYADIHIKVNQDVKNESEKILNEIGISMTDLINMALRSVIREKRIPFSTRIDKDLSENLRIETEEQLIEALDKRMKESGGKYITAEDFWDDFDKRHKINKGKTSQKL